MAGRSLTAHGAAVEMPTSGLLMLTALTLNSSQPTRQTMHFRVGFRTDLELPTLRTAVGTTQSGRQQLQVERTPCCWNQPKTWRSRHFLPTAKSSFFTQMQAGRLTFGRLTSTDKTQSKLRLI